MYFVKVHGGTTYEDIEAKVKQAEKMAEENQNTKIDTVLFFDEANTTEALSMIKEVMVDRRIHGRPIGMGQERLQFIAACNPYRRQSHLNLLFNYPNEIVSVAYLQQVLSISLLFLPSMAIWD